MESKRKYSPYRSVINNVEKKVKQNLENFVKNNNVRCYIQNYKSVIIQNKENTLPSFDKLCEKVIIPFNDLSKYHIINDEGSSTIQSINEIIELTGKSIISYRNPSSSHGPHYNNNERRRNVLSSSFSGRYRRSANNIRESLPVVKFSNSSNSSHVTETPSTSAGNIIEKGKNEEKSENSVKYYKISCPICLDNSTVSTRLDSTICGHVFCHECLSKALKFKKRCPVCRGSLRGRYAVHPLYLEE